MAIKKGVPRVLTRKELMQRKARFMDFGGTTDFSAHIHEENTDMYFIKKGNDKYYLVVS